MNQPKTTIQEAVNLVLEDMKRLDYASFTIGQYRYCYNGLVRYMENNGERYYTAEIGLGYIEEKFGIKAEGFFGTQPPNVSYTMRALQVLWDYIEYGSMVVKIRPGKKEFICPIQFKNEYAAHENEIQKHTPMSRQSHIGTIKKFLIFLNDAGIKTSSGITIEHILKFITSYSGCSTRYLATIVSVLKGYLKMLLAKGFISCDLTIGLPKIKITRGGFLPSSWKKEDVQKMLATIDRNNPEGKRDYAILLIITRLGLRVGDIRNLKLSSLNWSRKEITIITQKTKQPHTMPIFDDIGWALIDYLKNGRPKTTSGNVFIRHKAPYNAFSDFNSLNRMLGRRMNRAGVKVVGKQGLHSLRSTLARVMLENGAPLPVVSEALTHQNIQTTSIYVHIDFEGLKRCALDPEEVQP